MPSEENFIRAMFQCTGCESRCILLMTAENLEGPPEPMRCIFKTATVESEWAEKVD